jgi:hypothetical protein
MNRELNNVHHLRSVGAWHCHAPTWTIGTYTNTNQQPLIVISLWMRLWDLFGLRTVI